MIQEEEKKNMTSWARAVPRSGQVWFDKVIIDLWVLSLVFQPTQTPETLKLMIWKTTSTLFPTFSQYYFYFGKNQVTYQISAS